MPQSSNDNTFDDEQAFNDNFGRVTAAFQMSTSKSELISSVKNSVPRRQTEK